MKINYILFVVLFSLYSNLAYSNNPCAKFFDKVKEATSVAVIEAKKSLTAMQGELTQAKEILSETSQRGWGNVVKEKVDNVTGGVKNSAKAMARDAQQATDTAVEKMQTARSSSKENKEENIKPAEDTTVEKKDEEAVVSTGKEITYLIFLQKIDSLNLKPRTVNVLKAYKIDRIETLIEYSEEELLSMHNFGPKMLEEVKEALAERGLQLTVRLETSENDFLDFLNEVEKSASAMFEEAQQAIDTVFEKIQTTRSTSKESKEFELHSILKEDISVLDLKPDTERFLKDREIFNIKSLVFYSSRLGFPLFQRDLLRIPSFGLKSLEKLNRKINSVLPVLNIQNELENFEELNNEIKEALAEKAKKEGIYPFLQDIDVLGLKPSTERALRAEGFKTVLDLLENETSS